MKNVLKPSAKNTLVPLGLTVAGSAADLGIHKNSGFLDDSINNFRQRNGRYHDNG